MSAPVFFSMGNLEYQEGRTELDTLGEFALRERLTDGFERHNDSTVFGVGDDAAVLGTGSTKTLVAVNTMVEGIHFDMMYTPLKHLGYKAVAIAISNIAAMNGTPRQVLVSLAVSNRYSVEALDELYAGIHLCCDRYDVALVGGDTSSTRAGMVMSLPRSTPTAIIFPFLSGLAPCVVVVETGLHSLPGVR